MQINITLNTAQVQAALQKAASQVPFALSEAINRSAELARDDVQARMRQVFDRPTPWVLNSVRVAYARKTDLKAGIAYKNDWHSDGRSNTMVAPHVLGGHREFKAMEVRLMRAGLIPMGWNAVPGAAAKLDAFGNMSKGQITQMLNVLGTYTEAGYNKANAATVKRLGKGNVKKNIYGFVYWVNKVGSLKGKHLQPGVYQRVKTAFGTSLKPVLIFVKQANYKQRLDFFGGVQKTFEDAFPAQFDTAFDAAVRSALLKNQGSLL